jgi:hypothetical protein
MTISRRIAAIRTANVGLAVCMAGVVSMPPSIPSTEASTSPKVEETILCVGCDKRGNGEDGALFSDEIFNGIFLDESYGSDYHQTCRTGSSKPCTQRTCDGTWELRAWKSGPVLGDITFEQLTPPSSPTPYTLGDVNNKTVLVSVPFDRRCGYWEFRTVQITHGTLARQFTFKMGCEDCNGN